jgi:hypothetical protein
MKCTSCSPGKRSYSLSILLTLTLFTLILLPGKTSGQPKADTGSVSTSNTEIIVKHPENHFLLVHGKKIQLFSTLPVIKKLLPLTLDQDVEESKNKILSYYCDDKIPVYEGFTITAQIAFYVEVKTQQIIKQEIYYGFERPAVEGKLQQRELKKLIGLVRRTSIPFLIAPDTVHFDNHYSLSNQGQNYTLTISRVRVTGSQNSTREVSVVVTIPK